MFVLSNQQSTAVKRVGDWFKTFDFHSSKPYFELTGYAGSGKAQPLDAIVQTPMGPVPMGSLTVGQEVLGRDGKPTKVKGIFPQGVKDVYRVSFRDGTSTECCKDHLWNVSSGKDRANDKYKTIDLSTMIATGITRPSGDMRYRIPLNLPVDFDSSSSSFDPYMIGALLGDGYVKDTVVILVTPWEDFDIVERIKKSLPEDLSIKSREHPTCPRHVLIGENKWNGVKEHLNNQDIRVNSQDKFIPESYLFSTVEDRIALLNGLMDTDGSCIGNRTSFSTSSRRLADGVCYLVRSLGGVAILRSYVRESTKATEYQINVKTVFNPFYTQRKADKWKPSTKNPPSKYIKEVTFVAQKECQCIQVEAEDGLYLTDDFIVTHNTSILPSLVDATGLTAEDIAFMSPTGKAAKIMSEKMQGMGIGAKARTIHSTIYLPNRHRVEVLERQLETLRRLYDEFNVSGIAPEGYTHLPVDIARRKMGEDIIYIDNELDEAYDGDSTPSFSLNVESALRDKKLAIVDEASMVSEKMASDIMSFNIPVLAIGDKGQLPPVEGEWGFLTDDSDFQLTEIHRQAKDNPIIWLATLARQGKDLPLGRHGDTVNVVRRGKDERTLDMDRELQVICGTHRKRWNLTSKIRKAAGYTCQGPESGEPLIICKNSKKDQTIINGDFCTAVEDTPELKNGRASFPLKIEQTDGTIKTVFVYQGLLEQHYLRKKNGATADQKQAFKASASSEHIDFAHVITCHKSQGSQFDEVVLHDEGEIFGEDAARWRYTGITRAAEELTVVL